MTIDIPVASRAAAPSLGHLEHVPVEAPWGRLRWPGRRAATVLLELVAALACAATVHLLVGPLPLPVVAAVPLVWVALLWFCGGHADVPVAGVRGRAVLKAAAAMGVAGWTAVGVAPGLLGPDMASTARSAVLLMALLAATTLAVRLVSRSRARRTGTRTVLVGSPDKVEGMLRELRRAAGAGRSHIEPVALCVTDDGGSVASVDDWSGGLAVVRGTEDLAHAITTHRAEAAIVVPGGKIDHDELRRIGWQLQALRAKLLVCSGLLDVGQSRLELCAAGGHRLLHVRAAPLSGPARFAKDVVDRVGAAALLMALAPVLVAVAVLIRRDSPGPAIYRQQRVGRNGRQFTMYKLRTMCVDADRELASLVTANESDPNGALFKIRQDPRITRIGAILRKYSLDELPQLINVLRGEMSLVGPRPPLASEVANYAPDVRRRLVVRPGLTGLWQVSGRSDLSWEETVRLDLQYVDNWSLGLDVAIALRTAGAVLSHRGAY